MRIGNKGEKMKLTESQLRKVIRSVIKESGMGYFHNKYGQPIGSRFRGGELSQGVDRGRKNPDPQFEPARGLFYKWFRERCHEWSRGHDMYLEGSWLGTRGIFQSIIITDGTQKPFSIQFDLYAPESKVHEKGIKLNSVDQLRKMMEDPEIIKMQEVETKRVEARAARGY